MTENDASQNGSNSSNEQHEVLDFNQTVGELLEEHPKLKEAMGEFGLDNIDPSSTVPEALKGLDVDPQLVVTALQTFGYEVTGFTPEVNPYLSQIGTVIDALFNNDDTRASSTSVDPMMANIEAAVRRAEKNGILPTNTRDDN